MKDSKITKGRVNQKLQTRSEILKAAKTLMQKKKKITLEDVAKRANISRATMYRYYSKIDILFAEASLEVHHKSPDQINEEIQGLSFSEKLFYVQQHYNQSAQTNETTFRRYLSAVLSESVVSKKQLRGARRVSALSQVLAPYQASIDPETAKKLISAASVLMGIDALVVCKDVCKLDNQESGQMLKWALEMIIKGMIHDQPELQQIDRAGS